MITIKDIALSIAIEAIDNSIKIEPKYIIQFSRALIDFWIEELAENDLLRERLEKKTGKKISDVILDVDDVSDQLLKTLQDKTETRKEFFKLYSTNKDSDSRVIIYLPNVHGYIDWYEGPKLEITINSFKAIDLGFYRIGYDYKLADLDRSSWAVSISKDKKSEVVEFSDDKHIGRPTKEYIWLR